MWVPSPAVAFLPAGRAFLFYCTDSGCSIPSLKYVLRWHSEVYHRLRKKTGAGVSASCHASCLF